MTLRGDSYRGVRIEKTANHRAARHSNAIPLISPTEDSMENYHITHEDDRWVLREEGDKRALIETLTKEDILNETRDYMKLRTASVKIHAENGEVEEERSYPRDQDPRATKG